MIGAEKPTNFGKWFVAMLLKCPEFDPLKTDLASVAISYWGHTGRRLPAPLRAGPVGKYPTPEPGVKKTRKY